MEKERTDANTDMTSILLKAVNKFEALYHELTAARRKAKTDERLEQVNEKFLADEKVSDLLGDMTELTKRVVSQVGRRPGA